jgi:hypothetical protein
MRSLPWRRADLIERVRQDLWRYLTPAADIDTELLQAAALLQMRPSEVRTLGSLQFLLSDELGRLLAYLPFLLRRLATTTTQEEEVGAERVRGAIQWGRTLGLRYASGVPHLYVTAPSHRAYQTPENELLVFLLDQTIALGRQSGWHRSTSEEVGRMVSARVSEAERWSQSRMLLEVERRPVAPRALMRIRSGRFRRRYELVLAAYERHRDLVGKLDRDSIRTAVETNALVSRDDPVLFELYCTFATLGALRELGWRFGHFGLFAGALRLQGRRNGERLELLYQAVPRTMRIVSRYRRVQVAHGISPGGLRPDLVLHTTGGGGERWLMVEVKGGARPVEHAARAAAYDLLAYRTAFSSIFPRSEQPYGLGIAWGADLAPQAGSEIVLCTPDTLVEALQGLVPSP